MTQTPNFDDLPDEHRGIRLGVSQSGLDLHAALRFDYGCLGLNGRFRDAMRFVITSPNGSFCAELERLGRPRASPARQAPPGWVVSSHFTTPLVDLAGDQARPYFVYAFLGPYVSNVVRIEVVDPEAAP